MVMHFINTGYWGDIGIDVGEDMKILSFDPFYVKGIKLNDKILKINGEKADYKTFQKYILMAKTNKIVNVTVNNKTLKLKIRKKKYLFTPLEHYGILVNRNLTVLKLPEKIKRKYYIKEGVKLVKVNGKKINSFSMLKKMLSTYKNVTITLLIEGMTFTIPLR
jgi:S1-C subfamily serine protease